MWHVTPHHPPRPHSHYFENLYLNESTLSPQTKKICDIVAVKQLQIDSEYNLINLHATRKNVCDGIIYH